MASRRERDREREREREREPVGYTSDDDRRLSSPGGGGYRSPSPRDRVGRYRGGGGGGGDRRSSPPTGMNVNLNVEQMVSMVFEMRGTLAHEIESRRSTEHALSEARSQIEQLKDLSQRENNKWSNLLGRVKELEVAGKLDNRLSEMNTRAEKYQRNNDQGKLLQVFQEIKSRLDSQEREYRETFQKLAREQQRDNSRIEHDLRSIIDQQILKLDGQKQNDTDVITRLQNRIGEIEKEFAIFMNAQVLMQQNMNNKEKDGDWLKIYLTEQFNAQKHSTENQFKDVDHQFQRFQETLRLDLERSSDQFERKLSELHDSLEVERSQRESSNRKTSKALKTTLTTLSEQLGQTVNVLDGKMVMIKTTQNEAITNLHNMFQVQVEKFQQHLEAFQDFIGIQSTQTAKEHVLSQRLDSFEDVLKAEIKSRLKNHSKTKTSLEEFSKHFEGRFQELHKLEEDRRREEELLRQEEEEQARLLTIAMETRAVIESMVGQVEESHYIELRKNEWKAFGEVIEIELKQRDTEIDRKIAEGGGNHILEKVEQLQTYVTNAFEEFHDSERRLKEEEEDQAQMMMIAMETRAVVDSMITHIVDVNEASVLHLISSNIRALDERSHDQSDQLHSLKHSLEVIHESSTTQLSETHHEFVQLATELAQRVDEHAIKLSNFGDVEGILLRTSSELGSIKMNIQDLNETIDGQRKETANMRIRLEDFNDLNETQQRDLKNLKLSVTDLSETQSQHGSTLKLIQNNAADAILQSAQQRLELEQKLHSRVSETTAALSHSTAKVDELASIIKRLDQADRATEELSHSTETLSTKTVKLEQAFVGLQALVDDSSAAMDTKLKSLRDQLQSEGEETELAIKKVDKRLTLHIDDYDRLSSDFTSRSGGLSSSSKVTEEGLLELRTKLVTLEGLREKFELVRNDMKELQGQVDTLLPIEKHQRDLKDLQMKLHDVEDLHTKDLKTLRETFQHAEEFQMKQHKESLTRVQGLEERIQHLGKVGEDDSKIHQRRIVDASIVEKKVLSVEQSLDALTQKLKDSNNQQDDSLNRVVQDLKKVQLKVETIESIGMNAASSTGDSNIEHKKGLNDLSFRVDALENDMKVKTIGMMTNQIHDLSSKFEQRSREVDSKLISNELRHEKLEQEMKRLNELNDETDMKQNKRIKELQATIEQQAARDAEQQNAIKAEAAKQQIETDQAIKAAETRINTTIKTLQKQVDQQEVEFKSHSRSIDDKLHAMEWSLEYAKDASFQQDAKNIRAAGANPHHHKQQPQPPSHPPKATSPPPAPAPAPEVEKEPSYSDNTDQ